MCNGSVLTVTFFGADFVMFTTTEMVLNSPDYLKSSRKTRRT